jgi:hypothetical protein
MMLQTNFQDRWSVVWERRPQARQSIVVSCVVLWRYMLGKTLHEWVLNLLALKRDEENYVWAIVCRKMTDGWYLGSGARLRSWDHPCFCAMLTANRILLRVSCVLRREGELTTVGQLACYKERRHSVRYVDTGSNSHIWKFNKST